MRAAGGWRVRLRATAGIADLGDFANGELTALGADGSLPPVAQRRRFRLSSEAADIVGDQAVVLADGGAPAPPAGRYRLTADPGNPAGWTQIATVRRVSPVTGAMQSVEPLQLQIVTATALAGPPGRFTVELRPLPAATFLVPLASLLVGRELRQGGNRFVVLPGAGAATVDGGVPTSAAAVDRPRLVVAGSVPPTVGGCEVAHLHQYRLRVTAPPAYPPETAGGQLVLSAAGVRDPESLEVVSAPTRTVNQLTIWASTPSSTATPAGMPGAVGTYYPRHAFRITAPNELRADPANPVRTGFVAVSALADSGEASPLSAVAAVRAVPTPPTTPPDAPYPVADPTADVWWATPADVHGQATVAIGWDPPAGQDRTLHWEVCRALDLSVVAADHACWQLRRGHYRMGAPDGPGRAAVLAALGPEGAPLSVQVTGAALQPDGTTLLDIDPPLDAVAATRFDRGALEVTRGTTVSRFAVLALVRTGSAYRLRVGPGLDAAGARAAPPSSGAAVLLPPPDYGPALADDSLLRTLADLDGNDSAFQLVTVSPLVETRLTDRFPGRGRNRYAPRPRGRLGRQPDTDVPHGTAGALGRPALACGADGAGRGGWSRGGGAAVASGHRPGIVGYRLHRTIGDDVSAGIGTSPDVHGGSGGWGSRAAGARPDPAVVRRGDATARRRSAGAPTNQAVHARNTDGTVDRVANYWVSSRRRYAIAAWSASGRPLRSEPRWRWSSTAPTTPAQLGGSASPPCARAGRWSCRTTPAKALWTFGFPTRSTRCSACSPSRSTTRRSTRRANSRKPVRWVRCLRPGDRAADRRRRQRRNLRRRDRPRGPAHRCTS